MHEGPFQILEKPEFKTMENGEVVWLNPPGGHFVYIVESTNGPLKVGIALDPQTRLAALQTASPYTLRLRQAFLVPNESTAREIEQRSHKRFKQFSMRGEWFSMPYRAAEIGVVLEMKTIPTKFCSQADMERHISDAKWEQERLRESWREFDGGIMDFPEQPRTGISTGEALEIMARIDARIN